MTELRPGDLPPPDQIALLLDFDGTLAEIAASPSSVSVDVALPRLLRALGARCGGALAIVTGRPVAEIDCLLQGAVVTVAGLHGAEQRHDGRIRRLATPPALDRARDAVRALAGTTPGLLIEDKGLALAVHYRACPEAEAPLRRALSALTEAAAGALGLQPGKMVFELKPAGASKGEAVHSLMDRPPFAGRRPLFAGDDTTDEDGFAATLARGGIALKIGEGTTRAPNRLPDPACFRALLATYLTLHHPETR